MNDFASAHLIDGAIAIGLGVFIGLEREHSDVEPRLAAAGAAPSPGEAASTSTGTSAGYSAEGSTAAGAPVLRNESSAAAGAGSLSTGASLTATAAPAGVPRGVLAAAGLTGRSEHLGVRTFALVSLLGWLCALLEPTVRGISLVGMGVAGGVVALQYVRTWQSGSGVTTEMAALVTFGLGLVVRQNRLLAFTLAVLVVLLLISKPWVRRVVADIERRELIATLQLAVMLAMVLPLLPTEARDPWGVLAPRRLGLFVVLIAGLSFVGYVLSRRFGARHGAGLSGLLGGMVSSTAVTATMAERARRSPATIIPGQLATFLANAVMFIRVIVVSAVLSRSMAVRLAVPMVAMSVVMLAGAFWKWRALSRYDDPQDRTLPLQNPFALLPALKWAALLAVTLVAVAIATERFGVRGAFFTAALAGIAEVDAVNIAMNRQAEAGAMNVDLAVLAVTVATITSTVTKTVIVLASGGRRFGQQVALVFAAAIATGLLAALLG